MTPERRALARIIAAFKAHHRLGDSAWDELWDAVHSAEALLAEPVPEEVLARLDREGT